MALTDFLDYPFDIPSILRKRKAILNELLRSRREFVDVRIALLGGSTTSEVRNLLELFLLRDGCRPQFLESEYGKYFEDAVVDTSAVRAFRPQIVFLHTTQLNLMHAPALFAAANEVDECFAAEMHRFESIWSSLQRNLDCIIIQNNFDMPPLRSLGGLDSTELYGRTNFLLRLNLEFARVARGNRHLVINDIHHLSCRLGLDYWYNPEQWFGYKMAVSHSASVHLAHGVTRLIGAALGKTRKCLVLDLDNTLWGGVIGEDGVHGIRIGKETPQGEAYTAFQTYCRELSQRGVLLAACSKNDAENARQGFAHPDSILALESIASFRANWDPKPDNIRRIHEDLNIGLDSLVFVDDNPAERAFVRAQLPEVAVPDVGEEVSRFSVHLDREGYFEAVHLNRDDAQRSTFYSENTKRADYEAQFTSYAEFLDSLSMEAEIGSFSPVYLDRICQLTNKTNQFNLTTRRHTLPEMEAMARSDEFVTLYGRLKDKFGDNGLVSVIAARLAEQELHVELWLMSCRVLKRDMELAMLDALVARAAARGARRIVGYYYRTAKNDMVAQHYGALGFERISAQSDGSQSVWQLPVEGYSPRNKHIREIHV